MDSVEVLLEVGADPSIADEEGFSCLHAAIDGYCSKDTLQALIDNGARIDATRKDGTNALLRACITGQSESVMFLVEAGADVNLVKPNGNTCLYEAINGFCNKKALQKIIQQGVNVNFVNNRSETALLLSCYTAQAESINLLLENGADPNISDAYSYTCLHAAVNGCCPNETLQEIINHNAQLDVQDNDRKTALWLACRYKKQDFIKILLSNRSNPNFADYNGYTCLHAAVIGRCSKNIVSILLDHYADVNVRDKSGNVTALMIACQNGNKNVINILLNAGADPNITDDDGYSCLHCAVENDCCTEILQAIIHYGGDVNATGFHNGTALMIACRKRNKDAINVLLNAGTDPKVTDINGNTCLHCAARNDCCTEVLQAIISHGGDVNATGFHNKTALMNSCTNRNKDAIKILLDAGTDPNITDINGDTYLHCVTENDCSTEILQAIICHGGNVNATGFHNKTALMIACRKRNKNAINVLLDAGTDPNITDINGDTCLHCAAENDCCTELLKAIISHGGDVNATG